MLDEATAALGEPGAARVCNSRRLADQGQGVLVVSHRITEVLSIADRATVLRDGRVAATLAGAPLDEEHALAVMATPGGTQAATVRTPAERSEPVLVVEDLVGQRVHGVSLCVRPNEVVGLAAEPRAAASELLQMIFGAAPVRSGALRVAGAAHETNGVREAMRAGMAYMPGDRATATFGDMTIAQNLSAATVPTYWQRGRLRTRREREDPRRSMRQFSVAASAPEQVFRTLSGGNQQKVLLARWLRRGPRVLLLDEPTRGVDVVARREIAAAVRAAAAAGAGVLLASDDYEELCAVADRVVVLVDGRGAGETPARSTRCRSRGSWRRRRRPPMSKPRCASGARTACAARATTAGSASRALHPRDPVRGDARVLQRVEQDRRHVPHCRQHQECAGEPVGDRDPVARHHDPVGERPLRLRRRSGRWALAGAHRRLHGPARRSARCRVLVGLAVGVTVGVVTGTTGRRSG